MGSCRVIEELSVKIAIAVDSCLYRDSSPLGATAAAAAAAATAAAAAAVAAVAAWWWSYSQSAAQVERDAAAALALSATIVDLMCCAVEVSLWHSC